MTASQYHFNTINREYSVLKSYSRISIVTFRIQILFFKNLYHLNSESKENFLRGCSYGGELTRLGGLAYLGGMIFIPRSHGIFYLRSIKKFVMPQEKDCWIK